MKPAKTAVTLFLAVVTTLSVATVEGLPATAATPATAICNTYCDARDPGLSTQDRVPVTAALSGRTVALHFDDADAMGWASVDGGGAGDEVWLDRSFDGGATWSSGSKLGDTTTPSGQTGWRTLMYNVDDWNNDGVGALRACASVGGFHRVYVVGAVELERVEPGYGGGDGVDDVVQPEFRAVRRQRVVDGCERADGGDRRRAGERYAELRVRDLVHVRQEHQRAGGQLHQQLPGRHRLVGSGVGGRVRPDR